MSHEKLFTPGPVEVHPDILAAMAMPMIGHRSSEYAQLHDEVVRGLKHLFFTSGHVFLSTSSAFGVMEGAIRNLVGERCVNFCNGAFSNKWHDVTLRCGKQADPVKVEWGKPITPEIVDQALATGKYDSFTFIHNETSTGVMSPLFEIMEVARRYPDVVSIVDIVSSASALCIPIDTFEIDSCIFGVQKAFGLPPGLAVFTASKKALERAKTMEGRGYYFDYLEFVENDKKHNTPSTPCISQIYALRKQLERIRQEGFEERWNRHSQMQEFVHQWLQANGFELFPELEYCSRTLTCAKNTRNIDLSILKKRMGERGYSMDDGYGKIKGETFRIAHMGDMQIPDLWEFTQVLEEEIFHL